MWQDVLLAIVNWTLFVSLIPTVLSKTQKPTLLTSILTAVALAAITFTYATLSLWFAALPVLLTASAWFVLAYQRYKLNNVT